MVTTGPDQRLTACGPCADRDGADSVPGDEVQQPDDCRAGDVDSAVTAGQLDAVSSEREAAFGKERAQVPVGVFGMLEGGKERHGYRSQRPLVPGGQLLNGVEEFRRPLAPGRDRLQCGGLVVGAVPAAARRAGEESGQLGITRYDRCNA